MPDRKEGRHETGTIQRGTDHSDSKEADARVKAAELCRKHGISDATFYNWRSRYGGLAVSELRRLRQLEEENRRLKGIVADQALDIRGRSRTC